MKLPAYSCTKPSGVEWLGDVPEHWGHIRLREGLKLVNGYPFDAEQFARGEGAPLVRIRDIFGTATEVTWAGEWIKAAATSNDDILVGMDGDFNVAWWRGGDAQLNQRVCCLRAKQDHLDQRFLFYFIPFPLKQLNDITYSTTVKHLSSFDVLKFRLFAPPISEQRAIGAFLDRETGRVDRLVAKKRELIERLKEKRTALISRTVTRGLPPPAARAAGLPANPPLQPSTLDWLGDIPAHWEVTKMSWVCASIRDGTHNPPDRADGIHRLLSVRNVQDGKFALLSDDRTMTAEDFAELQRSYTVEEGDIVLAIVGATTGKSAIVGKLENVTVQRSLAILRPNKSVISSSFLHYVIQSPVVQTEIELTVFKYSAQPGIYLEDIGRLVVVRPPLPEQAAIAAYLDKETAKLDALVGKVEEAVERLQEYRTALITAAVTGKIDVRKSDLRIT